MAFASRVDVACGRIDRHRSKESIVKTAVPVSTFAARLAGMLLAGALLPLTAAAQASPPATTAIPAGARQQTEELSGPGGPLQGAMTRMNRMTDPNAGKRPGDEKLSCEQIKAEFDDTNRKYTAQSAKQDTAQEAVESDARKAQTEASGPGAVASGFLGGLAAVGAHAIGAGDAYNEKLKAELMATQARRAALQNQFAQEAEATKALSDRGQILMSLSKAKGCTGLVYKP
jgi:hypothetical protein